MNEVEKKDEVKENMSLVDIISPYYAFIVKAFGKWSSEFSGLLGIVFTLLAMDLLPRPFVVGLLMFFVCLFSFGIAYKFAFAIYKDYQLEKIDIDKKKREANNGKTNS